VATMVATTGLVPVFTAVNDAILPLPPDASPIAGVSFTQLTALAVPVKLTAVVPAPLATI